MDVKALRSEIKKLQDKRKSKPISLTVFNESGPVGFKTIHMMVDALEALEKRISRLEQN